MLILKTSYQQMSLKLHEQFLTAIEKAKRPVIVLPHNANVDDFVTSFGCATLLLKLQKPIELVTSGGLMPKSLAFLNSSISVRGDLPNIKKLTLKIKSKDTKIDELSYNVVGDELHIHITPKTGEWNKEDVSVVTNLYKYDLIITIGSQELESLGDIYKNYSDFFFQIPIINIDHSSANDHFGQMNIVSINTVSNSEVLYELLKQIDRGLIDEEVATLLLTGMIYKTRSFRSENVTPNTLKVAGELIAYGARRDEIVQHLYKTRTVETLRLWGRALARLKSDEKDGIVWTLLTHQDFVNSGTDENSLENIIDELMMSSPNAKIALIFYERQNEGVSVILKVNRPYDALYLGAPFRASGRRDEAFLRMKEKSIVQAEKKVITHIKKTVASM